MADAALLTSLTEPMLQYGVLGIIFLYVIVSDWLARKERAKAEALRAQHDSDREKDCVKRIRELEDRQLKFMQTISASLVSVLRDLVDELRKHDFKVSTPSDLESLAEEETKIIRRKDGRRDS